MTEAGLELVLWLLLAFFLGGVAGCLLRAAAADGGAESGRPKPMVGGQLARVDSSGTSARPLK